MNDTAQDSPTPVLEVTGPDAFRWTAGEAAGSPVESPMFEV